jgi:GT2 family glycosyltransferase
VDVVIPAYRGLAQTQRCIGTVLADPLRPAGRVIVVDDQSPEPRLSAWLDRQATDGQITLVRNQRNLGFVASVNIGIEEAGTQDVVLLNSDTEVPSGWIARLAGHAYVTSRVASVSPSSNNATICGY